MRGQRPLGEVEALITNWYKAHPGYSARTLMGGRLAPTGPARAVSAQAQLMKRSVRHITMSVPVVIVAGGGTAAGGLVGAGIGRASGDAAAGAIIGASTDMMIDIED